MGELFRHLFLPHHTNNFRAKVLHVDFFAVYVILFFITSFTFRLIYRINPDILGYATDINIEKLVNLTNQKRAESGMTPLKFNDQLSQAAAGKANDMFGKDYWAHTAPDGKTPWDFINGAGYVYTVAGENLAKNFSNSDGVVEAWMNSPSHRENLLRSQYEDVGFAVVNGKLNGEETTLVVQMFGKKLTSAAIARNTDTQNSAIPVNEVEASENIPLVSPSAVPVAVLQPKSPSNFLSTNVEIVKKPIFDIPKISKKLTLSLSFILIVTLLIDGIYIWRKKIVRVSGKNSAHLLLMFGIVSVIWFMSFGSIL